MLPVPCLCNFFLFNFYFIFLMEMQKKKKKKKRKQSLTYRGSSIGFGLLAWVCGGQGCGFVGMGFWL
jgi:hypothetical protein